MPPAETQLFRFLVLRGPDSTRQVTPIQVGTGEGNPSDALNGLASKTAEFFKAADLEKTTVADALAALQPPANIAPQIGPSKVLSEARIRSALKDASRGRPLDRRAISAGSEQLTALAFLGAAQQLPATTTLADWLTLNPITIADPTPLPWLPKMALVRPPGVADHYVVRDTLLGYEMGEIEDIKNYLRGEKKDHSLRYLKVTEEEQVTEREQETDRVNETATQQRSKMSTTTRSEAEASMGLDARVQTDGQYGPTKVSTDVGFQYSSSSSESREAASEFSTDVLNRSVEKVREKELSRVTRRAKTEVEERRLHSVDNALGTGHTVGIYRWVESVWKASTYRIGPRLLLEFLIPEPGRAVFPTPAPAVPADFPPAPAPLADNLYDVLDAKEAARLAKLYGAEGLKAPVLETQMVGFSFGSADFKDNPDQRVGAVLVKDVKVPDGYVAETVIVIVTAMDRPDVDVASNIVVDVPGARPATFLDIPAGAPNPFMVQGGPGQVGRPNTDLRSYGVSVKSAFGPGATVPVSVYSEDVRGLAGFVELHCRVSEHTKQQWKLDTIQALSSAYRARLAEWESAKLARSFEAQPPKPDPDLDAICRHVCIASLLGKWPSTSAYIGPDGWPAPGALANAQGELILFLEQAFEWSNLQYVLYPHYWADPSRWQSLMSFDHANPKVREFLRSGAVRIVVPVPIAMSEAVLFFLGTGLPWFGGGAPIPDEPGYVSIADEIRESRKAVGEGGELVSEYRFTLPTALTILQSDGVLPAPPP